MNVLLLSPGYPSEMPHFTRGLAEVGATVLGVGEGPAAALPERVRRSISDYLQVRSLWDEEGTVREVTRWLRGTELDRVECLWEPGVLLAAKLREALGVPGLGPDRALPFRDKERMKQVLDGAGIRTPRHRSARTAEERTEAAEEIGYPLILKPVAGAGSADTYRVDEAEKLDEVLARLGHVEELSVEEFIDGEEYTFDAISVDGEVRYHNVAWYRPRPLVARSNEWISPQVVALRDVERRDLADGIRMGHEVLAALGFESGFTHMEWYRKADGEVVFGEIAARPPGAHQVDQMNYACDIDVFREWGRAIAFGAFEAEVERRYNVATIYKRAEGAGRITRIDGEETLSLYGEHIVWNYLSPVGSPRRDWHQTLVSDGFVMLRHPELDETLAMADEIASRVRLVAV